MSPKTTPMAPTASAMTACGLAWASWAVEDAAWGLMAGQGGATRRKAVQKVDPSTLRKR